MGGIKLWIGVFFGSHRTVLKSMLSNHLPLIRCHGVGIHVADSRAPRQEVELRSGRLANESYVRPCIEPLHECGLRRKSCRIITVLSDRLTEFPSFIDCLEDCYIRQSKRCGESWSAEFSARPSKRPRPRARSTKLGGLNCPEIF